MKKIIITMVAGLLMAGGLWAEEERVAYLCDLEDVIEGACKKGDFLQLFNKGFNRSPLKDNLAGYFLCDKEEGYVSNAFDVCIYNGKPFTEIKDR